MNIKMKETTRKLSIKDLRELLSQESSVFLEHASQHLAIMPSGLGDIKSAVKEALETSICKFDRKLNGIIMGYENVQMIPVADHGNIFYDDYLIHVDVEAHFFVFRPQVGHTFTGVVYKKAQDHVGCLILSQFSVSVPNNENSPDWIGNMVEMGQQITVTITLLNLTGRLPYICGRIESLGDVPVGPATYESKSTKINFEDDDSVIEEPLSNDFLEVPDTEESNSTFCDTMPESKKKKKKKKNKNTEYNSEAESHANSFLSSNESSVRKKKKKEKKKRKETSEGLNVNLKVSASSEDLCSVDKGTGTTPHESVESIEKIKLCNSPKHNKKERKRERRKLSLSAIYSSSGKKIKLEVDDNSLPSSVTEIKSGFLFATPETSAIKIKSRKRSCSEQSCSGSDKDNRRHKKMKLKVNAQKLNRDSADSNSDSNNESYYNIERKHFINVKQELSPSKQIEDEKTKLCSPLFSVNQTSVSEVLPQFSSTPLNQFTNSPKIKSHKTKGLKLTLSHNVKQSPRYDEKSTLDYNLDHDEDNAILHEDSHLSVSGKTKQLETDDSSSDSGVTMKSPSEKSQHSFKLSKVSSDMEDANMCNNIKNSSSDESDKKISPHTNIQNNINNISTESIMGGKVRDTYVGSDAETSSSSSPIKKQIKEKKVKSRHKNKSDDIVISSEAKTYKKHRVLNNLKNTESDRYSSSELDSNISKKSNSGKKLKKDSSSSSEIKHTVSSIKKSGADNKSEDDMNNKIDSKSQSSKRKSKEELIVTDNFEQTENDELNSSSDFSGKSPNKKKKKERLCSPKSKHSVLPQAYAHESIPNETKSTEEKGVDLDMPNALDALIKSTLETLTVQSPGSSSDIKKSFLSTKSGKIQSLEINTNKEHGVSDNIKNSEINRYISDSDFDTKSPSKIIRKECVSSSGGKLSVSPNKKPNNKSKGDNDIKVRNKAQSLKAKANEELREFDHFKQNISDNSSSESDRKSPSKIAFFPETELHGPAIKKDKMLSTGTKSRFSQNCVKDLVETVKVEPQDLDDPSSKEPEDFSVHDKKLNKESQLGKSASKSKQNISDSCNKNITPSSTNKKGKTKSDGPLDKFMYSPDLLSLTSNILSTIGTPSQQSGTSNTNSVSVDSKVLHNKNKDVKTIEDKSKKHKKHKEKTKNKKHKEKSEKKHKGSKKKRKEKGNARKSIADIRSSLLSSFLEKSA